MAYQGDERRSEGQRVVINGVKNGAQDDVDDMLDIIRKICLIAEAASKWLRRVGIILALGFIGFIFSVGMWYFKVDNHVEADEIQDATQDQLISTISITQARTVGVLEGIDRRLEILEARE
jgi:hypothetical protein